MPHVAVQERGMVIFAEKLQNNCRKVAEKLQKSEKKFADKKIVPIFAVY